MKNLKSKPIYNLMLSALFSSVTVLCAWISFPTVVPFTLQTLAIFIIALLLDLKYGLLSIGIYIGLGITGLPVFSGFQGGVGVLAGPSGGFIVGFILIVLVVGILKKLCKDIILLEIVFLATGLMFCYLFGTIWFMFVSQVDFLSALTVCVLPYLPFDAIKMIFAVIICKRLRKLI